MEQARVVCNVNHTRNSSASESGLLLEMHQCSNRLNLQALTPLGGGLLLIVNESWM